MRLKHPLPKPSPVLLSIAAWLLLLPLFTHKSWYGSDAILRLGTAWLLGLALLMSLGLRLSKRTQTPAEAAFLYWLGRLGMAIIGVMLGAAIPWTIWAATISIFGLDDPPGLDFLLVGIFIITVIPGAVVGLILGIFFPSLRRKFRTMRQERQMAEQSMAQHQQPSTPAD